MAETKSGGVNPLFLREEELRQGIELVFYAYRDFTSEADEILERYKFGRAHHRAIYFVGRNPGLTVTELLAILRISKQSLSRVLAQLVAEDLIVQEAKPPDRRKRLLTLTPKGAELERQLTQSQRERIARAYREAGAEAVQGYRKVILGMINPEDRQKFLDRAPLVVGTARGRR